MMKKLIMDDFSLLGNALALAAKKAPTLESLAAELNVRQEDLSLCWFALNNLRRCQGRVLPVPFEAVAEGPADVRSVSGNWYAPTWRLNKLLEEFQVNEGLAVQAREPANGIELLVSNAGKILISIEDYREGPFTVAFIERLHERLVEGISIKEVREIEGCGESAADELRAKALESFCAHVCAPDGGHTLVDALIALCYFKAFHLFSAGNDVLAYLLYFIVLHRAGYHFSAHVPVVKLLFPLDDDDRVCDSPLVPEELVVPCDGFCDWTLFFERAVQMLVEGQRWFMTKLDGMARRRERFRIIIDSDESMNFRQKEVLLEAVLHSNAEFTYGIHAQRYDVSYPCARSDFARLLDQGFLRQHDDGIRHFFVASDEFEDVFATYVRERCAEALHRYYREDGALRDECKSPDDIAAEYNRGVGFYEKSLLDKTYIEHYDFRRTPIADCDGPRRRRRSNDE